MKKLIIRHNDFILKVHASENNTTIFDSYRVKNLQDMNILIYCIKVKTSEKYAINKRSVSSMVNEWRVHNLLYSLGVLRNRTKDVDLNIDQSWYMKILYLVLSPFYLHFK